MNGIGPLTTALNTPPGAKAWVGSSGLLARRSSIWPYIGPVGPLGALF